MIVQEFLIVRSDIQCNWKTFERIYAANQAVTRRQIRTLNKKMRLRVYRGLGGAYLCLDVVNKRGMQARSSIAPQYPTSWHY